MTDITEHPELFPSVPLMQRGTDVRGGDEDAPANWQAVALTARTAYLKNQLDKLAAKGGHVIGTLASQAELDAIDTQLLSEGDGYFVEGALILWNGQEWISSGSLIGQAGEPVNLISDSPDNILSLGEDGKLHVSNDISIDLLSVYNLAKE